MGDVLVCNGEVQAVFSSLGKNDGEGIGCKVLELVDVKVEWATITDIRDVRTAHGGELDFCDEESAENTSIVFTNETFRKVYDENLSFIHDFSDIEAGFWLADDITDNWVGCEGTNLVQNRRDTFVDLFFVPLAKFVFPELENGDIFTIVEGFFSKIFIS